MSGPYVSKSPVRFHHTDPASYVFFPRDFEMFQAAVEDWFTVALGVNYADLINDEQIGLPTAKTECEFARPCRLGEVVDLAIYLVRLGTSSLEAVFDGTVDGEHRLRARSVLVFISLVDGHSARPSPRSGLSWKPTSSARATCRSYRAGDRYLAKKSGTARSASARAALSVPMVGDPPPRKVMCSSRRGARLGASKPCRAPG